MNTLNASSVLSCQGCDCGGAVVPQRGEGLEISLCHQGPAGQPTGTLGVCAALTWMPAPPPLSLPAIVRMVGIFTFPDILVVYISRCHRKKNG